MSKLLFPKWILVALFILLALFTYFEMFGFVFMVSSSIPDYIRLVTIVLMVVSIFSHGRWPRFKGLNSMWFWWFVFYVIVFLLFGLRGEGVPDMVQVFFAPATYFICYCYASKRSDSLVASSSLSLIVLFVATAMIYVGNSLKQVDISNEGDIIANNLYFYMLCLTPFIFLIKNQVFKNILLLMSVAFCIITVKRSALIAISLILILYVYDIVMRGQRKNRFQRLVFICVFIFGVYYLLNNQLSTATNVVMERMDSMSEDQGTGRIPLYADVINDMVYRNDLPSWVIGNGIGSIKQTQHSNAHNDALQMLYEFGIIGLLLYLWLVKNIIQRTVYLYRRNHLLFLPYASSAIIVITLGMVSNLVVFYSYFAFITALWGIVEGYIDKESTCQVNARVFLNN